MRYDDASQAGSMADDHSPVARPDVDALAPNNYGPASGNVISGAGTTTGASGADSVGDAPGIIVAVQGAGGPATNADGSFHANGQYGVLSMDAQGNFNYTRNAGTPDGVQDVFNYTLADRDGQTSSTSLSFDIAKGGVGQAAVVPGTAPVIPGVVTLPAGVQMSDIHVVGRDLVINMPDGTQMVIPNGAVFVPQLVIGDVQLPASNLAALLVESEPQPAAGQLQSSGGNFATDVPPLDPGVPLGDLIPPTELNFPPPQTIPVGQFEDLKPEAGSVSVQLADDALQGGNPGGVGDDPDSVNATGFLPGSGGDLPIHFDLLTDGAPSGFSYVDGPNGSILVQQVQNGSTVTVLTITVDAATGAYTVTQNAAIMHPAGGDENNVSFVINYNVIDNNGDAAPGTLNVNVDDDTPVVHVQAGPDAEVILTTHDAASIPGDGTPDTAVTTANFSGVFSGSTVSFGADGPGPGTSDTYALAVTGSSSGLTSHGAAINLFLVSGVVVGSTATSAGAIDAGNTIFTVSTTNAGIVTLTQFQQIDHPIGQDPSATAAPFDDQIISMADGLVTLTRSETAVDGDGDQVTGSATINIGANLHFTDDGPTIAPTLNEVGPAVLDESPPSDNPAIALVGGFTAGDDPDLSGGIAIGQGSTSGAVIDPHALFGADGPAAGGGIAYALDVLNATSGLTTTDGTAIDLVQLANGVVIGVVEGTTTAAFAISINSTTGVVSVEQYLSLSHPDSSNPDDVVQLSEGSLGVHVTATDFDGDTATSSPVDITSLIQFHDDGPSVTLNAVAEPSLTVDETNFGGDAGPTSFAGMFNFNFGADGPASTNSIQYNLGINGGSTGLVDTLTQQAVVLSLVNGQVIGTAGAGGPTVFVISVDADGNVSLDQQRSVVHADPNDPNDSVTFLSDNLITLSATVTDGDGDTATVGTPLAIAQDFHFLDDAPSVSPTLNANATVTVDESLPSDPSAINTGGIVKGDDPDLAGDIAIGKSNSGGAIVDPHAAFGADGPAASNSISYALSITNASSGVTLTDGTTISLQLVGGVIVGVVDGSGTFGGEAAFAISIDSSTGVVTVEQYLSLDHPLNPNPNDPLQLGNNTIGVTVTATDGDGDHVTSGAVDISHQITFLDDGPAVAPTLNVNSTVTVDESLPSNNPAINTGDIVKGDDPDLGGGIAIGQANSGAAIVDPHAVFGADGPAAGGGIAYSLSILNTSSGLTLTDGTAINLQNVNGVIVGVVASGTFGGQAAFAIAINATTGVVSVEQYLSLDHPLNPNPNDPLHFGSSVIGVTVTATDGDGDPVTSPAVDIGGQITFLDDGPAANPDTDSVGAVGQTATGNVITGAGTDAGTANADVPGADGFGSITNLVGFNGSTDGNATGGFDVLGQYGTLHMNTDGSYTYTRTGGPGGATDQFTYTYVDGDGDPASSTLTITLGDSTPTAGTVNATLDDDALAGGNPGGVGDDSPDTSNLTGNLPGSGGDAPLTFGVLLTGAPSGFSYVSGGAGVVLIQQGGITKITVTVHTDGSYTIVQNAPVDHAAGGNENNQLFAVTYTVTDSDTDQAQGTININVDDDTPTVSANAAVQLDDDALAGGNPGGTGDVNPDTANTTGTLAHSYGADGAGSIVYLNTGAPGGFSYALQGNGDLWVMQGATHVITLTVNATTGAYTVTQVAPIDHTAGGNENNQSFTIGYRVTDHDGDTADGSIVINVNDDTPTVSASTTQPTLTVDETTLANNSTADFSGVFTHSFGADGAAAANSITYALGITGGNGVASGLTDTATGLSIVLVNNAGVIEGHVGTAAGALAFTVSVNATGSVTLDQIRAVVHTSSDNPDTSEPATLANDNLITLTQTVTDHDGDSASATANIGQNLSFLDDGPTLGTVQSQQTDNNPATAPAVGTLHFTPGADGAGSAMIITADNTGITSGGHALLTVQNGNVLTAYQDTNNDGIHQAGESTIVYTLTVNPTAGTSGQYVFDLVTPLDPTVTEVDIGGSSSFGAGPTLGQTLTDGAVPTPHPLSVVSGYHPTAGFDVSLWLSTGALPTSSVTSAGVNGSTAGWGVDNNNFETNSGNTLPAQELMFFDFGSQPLSDPDGAGGAFNPPAVSLPNITFAKFDFINYKAGALNAGDDIAYVVHFTDGTFTSGWVPDANINGATWQFNAPGGKFIADVQFYSGIEPDGTTVQNLGPGKIDLVSVGTTTSTLNQTIDFTVQLTDGDGDPTSTGAFTVQVADGLSPVSPASLTTLTTTSTTSSSTMSTLTLASTSDTQKSSTETTTNSNSILMGAFAAAGLAASEPLAAENNHSGQSVDDHAVDAVAQHTEALAPVAADAVGGAHGIELAAIASDGRSADAGVQSSGAHGDEGNFSQRSVDDGAVQSDGHAPSALSQGTDAPASHGGDAPAALTANGIAMPDAALLVAAAQGHAGLGGHTPSVDAQHNQVVGQVLADALHGGGNAPNVEALINSLPQVADHGQTAADALASHAAGAVPNGDMGVFAGFTGAAGLHMMHQMAHADAVPAHA